MAEETHKLKNMRAIRSEGVLYVAEKDCRENVAEALAQKKPLLEKIAALVAALEGLEPYLATERSALDDAALNEGMVSGFSVASLRARAALEKAKG